MGAAQRMSDSAELVNLASIASAHGDTGFRRGYDAKATAVEARLWRKDVGAAAVEPGSFAHANILLGLCRSTATAHELASPIEARWQPDGESLRAAASAIDRRRRLKICEQRCRSNHAISELSRHRRTGRRAGRAAQ